MSTDVSLEYLPLGALKPYPRKARIVSHSVVLLTALVAELSGKDRNDQLATAGKLTRG